MNEKKNVDLQMQIFSLLWAIATLYHINTVPLDTWSNIALLVSAFLLIRFPKDNKLLILLACIQLIDMWSYLPRGSNHWLHTSALNIVIVFIYLKTIFRQTKAVQENYFEFLVPYARALTLVIYFFAVFQKLNIDFFDPATSCGAVLPSLFLKSIFPFSASVLLSWFGIASTIIFESLIPILLIIPKTRVIGCIVGVLFHTALSLNPALPVADFTAFLIPLYYTFLPSEFSTFIHSLINRRLKVLPPKFKWLLAKPNIILGILLASFVYSAFTLWIVYTLCILALLIYYSWQRLPLINPSVHIARARPSSGLILFLTLLSLNGMSPHLGLKTELSLSMFSNLRTEFNSNHLLLADHLKYFEGYQDPVIDIQSSEARLVEKTKPRHGLAISRFTLEMTILQTIEELAAEGRKGELKVSYLIGSKRFNETYPIATRGEWFNFRLYLINKLLPFRRIYHQGPTPCRH